MRKCEVKGCPNPGNEVVVQTQINGIIRSTMHTVCSEHLPDLARWALENNGVIEPNQSGNFLNSEGQMLWDMLRNMNQAQWMAGVGAKRKKEEQTEGKIPSAIAGFGSDLTEEARHGALPKTIGRDKEINQVLETMLRAMRGNPLLVGETGVGKTAIFNGVAQRIADGNVHDSLKDKHIFLLSLNSLVAGSKYRGEFEERLKRIIDFFVENPNYILAVDEMHSIIGAGAAEGALDASNILKPYINDGKIRLMGATTFDELQKYIKSSDKAWYRRFNQINVEEPVGEDLFQIVRGVADDISKKHDGLTVSDDVIRYIIRQADRYVTNFFFPDKALDILDRVMAHKKFVMGGDIAKKISDAVAKEDFDLAAKLRDMRDKGLDVDKTISKSDVDEVIAASTGIPINELTKSEAEKLANLKATLEKQVIGQDEAIEKVARAVKRGVAGIRERSGPILVAYFAGPTGTGKTEVAKSIARTLYPGGSSFMKIDMSEFSDPHDKSKIIGSPPGYVGYEEAGPLTEFIDKHRYCVILLDEFEKAHPNVQQLFLQMFDEGRLTDGKGRTVDCKNTIVIMTSNLGVAEMNRNGLGFERDDPKAKTEKKIERMFSALKQLSPEFRNRVDDFAVFRPLSLETMEVIAEKNIRETISGIIKDDSVTISFDNDVPKWFAEKTKDQIAEYGARPTIRLIEEVVGDLIATKRIAGVFTQGGKWKMVVSDDTIDMVPSAAKEVKSVAEKTEKPDDSIDFDLEG